MDFSTVFGERLCLSPFLVPADKAVFQFFRHGPAGNMSHLPHAPKSAEKAIPLLPFPWYTSQGLHSVNLAIHSLHSRSVCCCFPPMELAGKLTAQLFFLKQKENLPVKEWSAAWKSNSPLAWKHLSKSCAAILGEILFHLQGLQFKYGKLTFSPPVFFQDNGSRQILMPMLDKLVVLW